VLADAAKFTGDPTTAPLAGLLTLTLANADTDKNVEVTIAEQTHFFMTRLLSGLTTASYETQSRGGALAKEASPS